MNNDPDYHAYLLRLWRVTDRGRAVWRASLQVPGEAARHTFASFPALVRFLAAQIHQPPPWSPCPPDDLDDDICK